MCHLDLWCPVARESLAGRRTSDPSMMDPWLRSERVDWERLSRVASNWQRWFGCLQRDQAGTQRAARSERVNSEMSYDGRRKICTAVVVVQDEGCESCRCQGRPSSEDTWQGSRAKIVEEGKRRLQVAGVEPLGPEEAVEEKKEKGGVKRSIG